MKKLLGIIVLGLLWSGNVYAENITLICKFVSGEHLDLDRKVLKFKSSDGVAKDVLVKLDTKRKKLIDTSSYTNSDNATVLWEEDFIQWWPNRNTKISDTSLKLEYLQDQV